MTPESEPTRARKIVSALVVAIFAVAIWEFVEWRSAPPPPPKIAIPGK